VSDYLNPDEDEPNDGSRRRALWGLVVLGCLALIIGSLMLLLGGGSDKKKDNADLDVPPVSSTPTSTGRTTASHSASSTTAKPTSTAPTSPPRTGNPCSGRSACGVAGDGGVVAALNGYRTAHGKKVVTGSATASAETCALHKGADKFCADHWIYTVVASQNGSDCIKGFTGFNPTWMLDQKMTSFSVGWAYDGGSYQCAVTKTLSTD
jgi:hypothetical protein